MRKLESRLPAGIPKVIYVEPLPVYEIPKNAETVGIRIYNLRWPRRKIVDRLQLRLEYYLDAGGFYKTREGEIYPIYEDTVERCFKDDPSYKWLSDFPKRCKEEGVIQSPSGYIQMRLQGLDMALKTHPLGWAI